MQKKLINIMIAMVWFANGLFYKLLHLVPRHQQIVGEILGQRFAGKISMAIGIAEVLLGIWVISGIRPRTCAIFQVLIILTMNIIEFIMAPKLLLFGRFNLLFALMLCALILWNEFRAENKKTAA